MVQQYSHPTTNYQFNDPFWRSPAAIRHHLGSDYAPAEGTPIYAVADGYLVANRWTSVLGNVAGQQNDDGIFFGYGHMLAPCRLALGTRLVRGVTVIGYVGETGSAANGPHLHLSCGTTFEAIFGGEPLFDPWASIEAHLIGTAGTGIVTRPPEKKKEPITMYILKSNGYGAWQIIPGIPGKARHILSIDELAQLEGFFPVKDCGSNDAAFMYFFRGSTTLPMPAKV